MIMRREMFICAFHLLATVGLATEPIMLDNAAESTSKDTLLAEATDDAGSRLTLTAKEPADATWPPRISDNRAITISVQEHGAGANTSVVPRWSCTLQHPWLAGERPACALGVSRTKICVVVALSEVTVFFSPRFGMIDLDEVGKKQASTIAVPGARPGATLAEVRSASARAGDVAFLPWRLLAAAGEEQINKLRPVAAKYVEDRWKIEFNYMDRTYVAFYDETKKGDAAWDVRLAESKDAVINKPE
jgi:hypothetical protein